jgi:5-(hydroxymethyl)furfural/furfural oxidase
LSSADWRQEPDVDFNLLSDHRDLVRLAKGFREIAALHELAPLKAVTSDAFPASFTDKIRKVGTYNTKNRILTSLGAALMDGPSFLRRAFIRGFIVESAGLVHARKDDGR